MVIKQYITGSPRETNFFKIKNLRTFLIIILKYVTENNLKLKL